MNFQRGGKSRFKTHYRAAEIAEKEWVEYSS